MADQTQSTFDFDSWSSIAADDPETFEAMRQAAIDELIENAPLARQKYLRALQWRIDQERQRSKTPLGACIRISRMMWERVMGDGGLMDHLQLLQGGMEQVAGQPVSERPLQGVSAEVLPFKPRNR